MKKIIFSFLFLAAAIFALDWYIREEFYLGLRNSSEKKEVLGEESEADSDGTVFKSDNFRISQLNINEDSYLNISSEDESMPIVISEVKSEVFNVKDKDETRMVLSWKTNKASKSEVSYFKKGESLQKSAKEEEFGLDHSASLPSLDADTVYAYKITARDRWGREKVSDEYVFYTGTPNVSLIDVLQNAAGKLFGWAIRK